MYIYICLVAAQGRRGRAARRDEGLGAEEAFCMCCVTTIIICCYIVVFYLRFFCSICVYCSICVIIIKLFTLLDLCASTLRRGHANLLCIVPMLTDDPRRESNVNSSVTTIIIYHHISSLSDTNDTTMLLYHHM